MREDVGERAAPSELARRGSTSASTIDYLGLARDLVEEIFTMLRGERKLQVGLARILGAARRKVLT